MTRRPLAPGLTGADEAGAASAPDELTVVYDLIASPDTALEDVWTVLLSLPRPIHALMRYVTAWGDSAQHRLAELLEVLPPSKKTSLLAETRREKWFRNAWEKKGGSNASRT